MPTPLLVSGLPGKMALEVLRIIPEYDEFESVPFCLSSEPHDGKFIDLDALSVECKSPTSRKAMVIRPGTMAIDYSTPDSALDNIRWYVDKGIPFVCGTTGFDMDMAHKIVSTSNIPAVIAPNMAIPVVLIQAAIEMLVERFPNTLPEFELSVTESHQATKRDTSGTAKALIQYFQKLGVDFEIDGLKKVREPEIQKTETGVPEEFLDGHAYHHWKLQGAKNSVDLELKHNIRGRRIYAEGTMLALRFLQNQVSKGVKGKVFNLIDVLEQGTDK